MAGRYEQQLGVGAIDTGVYDCNLGFERGAW